MKKRMLSLLCVLALCLGLLPVTALADAPENQVIYVGGKEVTSGGYWTTDSDGNVTASTAGETPTDNYIRYDAENNVLTLHNATIKNELEFNESIEGGTYINGSAIGVFNQSGNAELTISLVGTNTIANVGKGIFVLASSASTGSSNLTIQGDGSLNASASQTDIWVQSNSNNAALCVENAEVTASADGAVKNGVLVQAKDGSDVSLTVNGGSLTASVNANISFQFGSGLSGSGTPTVTVSNNAIVRANGGIANNSSTSIQYGTGNEENGGIVFDGNTGTVYGNVTLQENLEIGEGESLTISDGASLETNGKLTVNGGTLNGKPNGNVIYKVTGVNLDQTAISLAVGGTAALNATITPANATNQNLTWSSDNTNVATVASGTVTAVGKGSTNITVTTEDGQYKAVCAVTVTQPVTGVLLNTGTLTLFTGDTATLTATVQPDSATNKNVTWSSDNEAVATVDNSGKITAVTAGEANITVKTEDGNHSADCKVTVTQSAYSISADTTALNFGSVYTGYTQPAAQTVTVKNTGNRQVMVTLPTANDFIITAGTGFTNGSASIEPSGTATFTVQPKAGLAVGTYSENITVSGAGGATVTITANFTVKQYSSGGGTPTKTPSQQATDKIEAAKDGSTVEIKLSTGSTKLDKEVFEELAGREVTLEISLPGGVSWTVNGQDIPENTDLTDLDLGVTLDASTIPVSVVNTITGAVDTIQLSLKHDGEFGFTMILSAPLGETNAGYWANLYYYNTRTRALEFQSASKIATDGTASFPFSHASDYAIVIDTDSHEPVELPFTDVPEGAWYEDAAAYVYKHGLMAGTSATTFAPDVTTSRAMIATILWRMAGSPVVNYAMNYTDVAQGQWCSEAIRWATSEGVVTGYGNGLFGTNDPITREQLATMLWRYAQTEGYDVSIGEDTNILSYTDVADLSEYAIPAMQWAVGAGIINGTGDGSTLSPQGQATRAQAAVMLMRFCEEYVVW